MSVLLLNNRSNAQSGMNAYRARARDRAIEGQNKDLAREARRLLGWDDGERPFVSTRTAARKTGLSNGTIAALTHGDPSSPETLIKFGRGMGGDVARLLRLGGHEDMAQGMAGTEPAAWLTDLVSVSAGITYGELMSRIQEAVQGRVAEGLPPASYRVDVRTGKITVEVEAEE